MIRFQCTQCHSSLRVPDSYAGKAIRCPKCKEPTSVPDGQKNNGEPGHATASKSKSKKPSGVTETDTAATQHTTSAHKYQPPRRKHKRRSDISPVLIGLVLFVGLAGVGIGFVAGRNSMVEKYSSLQVVCDGLQKKVDANVAAQKLAASQKNIAGQSTSSTTTTVAKSLKFEPYPTEISGTQPNNIYSIENYQANIRKLDGGGTHIRAVVKLRNISDSIAFFNIRHEFVDQNGQVIHIEHDQTPKMADNQSLSLSSDWYPDVSQEGLAVKARIVVEPVEPTQQ